MRDGFRDKHLNLPIVVADVAPWPSKVPSCSPTSMHIPTVVVGNNNRPDVDDECVMVQYRSFLFASLQQGRVQRVM